MTKEHGLVGNVTKVGPVAEKDLYDMAKSFASSVGKGEIEAKHGTEESNNTPY
tara:strand:+ start:123 stop:281 length:159 start_codon:yes stop_codon:yes gene_type:complete